MKRSSVLFVLACSFAALVCAQSIEPLGKPKGLIKPEAVVLTGGEIIVPELILGGEWTSSIRLVNQTGAPVGKTLVYFFDSNGHPMVTTFRTSTGNVVTDTGFSFNLLVGGMLEGVFAGGPNVQFGHAVIASQLQAGLYGEVTLTNRNPTRPDFQSVFPFELPANVQYLCFDGRNGFSTTLYVVNENPNAAATISMEVRDDYNNLLRTVNIPLPALGSGIYTLHAIAPETIGIQGTLVFRSGFLATVTGLRINPTNSFTPVRTFLRQ